MLEQLKYYDGNLQMIGGIPDNLKEKYKEAFDIDPHTLIDIAAARGKWIDQSQSLNIFIKGVSGKKLYETYIYAWQKGLKTTYYLRGMAATQIEKATLDASKFGFTQKRDYDIIDKKDEVVNDISVNPISQSLNKSEPNLCSIEDTDCEACQ